MQLQANLDDSRYDWTARILTSLVAASPSKHVWDIGAGDGRMKPRIEAAGGIYHGLDLVPSNPQIQRWNLDEPPVCPNGPVGGAILLDVIEHCNNPGRALHHIAEALLPQGFLVVTMPNPRWSRSRLFALLSGQLCCFTQSDLDLNHHVFTTWPHIVEYLLRDAGFSIEYYATLEGKREWPEWSPDLHFPVRMVVAAAMKGIERRDPGACGMSFGVIARKTQQVPPA